MLKVMGSQSFNYPLHFCTSQNTDGGISTILKTIIVPSQMGAGTGHRRRGAEEFRENARRTTEYAAYGAKHRRARSARGDGE